MEEEREGFWKGELAMNWVRSPYHFARSSSSHFSIQHYYNHSYIVHSQFILSSSLVIAMSKNLFSSHFFRRKYSYRTTGVTNLRIVVSNTVTTFLIWNWRKSTLPQKCKIPSLFMINHWYWNWQHCLQWFDKRLYDNTSLYTLRTLSYIKVFSYSKCIQTWASKNVNASMLFLMFLCIFRIWNIHFHFLLFICFVWKVDMLPCKAQPPKHNEPCWLDIIDTPSICAR